MTEDKAHLVLRLACPDRTGILAEIVPFLAENGCDIRDSAVYGDPESQRFFVRMRLRSYHLDSAALAQQFDPIARGLAAEWSVRPVARRLRVLVAVSKFDHCLNDLLHKAEIGALPIEIVGVVSNHETLRPLAEWRGAEFHHLPVAKDTKSTQEAAFAELVASTGAQLVVLARYMQVLSDDFARLLFGRCINIHHSFLPSFKGARPYHQAHGRGVKLIGATAHYVTPELDEGPIIEQDVRRITHAASADEMIAIGREVEASVLARAVKWHAEGRIFANGARTVVLE